MQTAPSTKIVGVSNNFPHA